MEAASAFSVPDGPPDGLIVLLPARSGGGWRWWRVEQGGLGRERSFLADAETAPWGRLAEGSVVTALVPAARAPVRDQPMPDMPPAQAIAAARLEAEAQGIGSARRHAAAARAEGRLLCVTVDADDMDRWLGELAEAGFDAAALVPAALVLPRPDAGMVVAELGDEPLARTPAAAFAGEPALIGLLADGAGTVALAAETLDARLLAIHRAPPVNLRQGVYAPRGPGFLSGMQGGQLARMAAVVALLVLVLMLVWIAKWELAASTREQDALALAQRRFPAASDLDSAERLVAADMAKRGQGAANFTAPMAAVLAAMQPVPSIRLRDLGYSADGTLRFTAAAPRAEDVNAVLIALQNAGWKVTVPPSLASDPTGATVVAITVRAP